jgi:hypothetical protein
MNIPNAKIAYTLFRNHWYTFEKKICTNKTEKMVKSKNKFSVEADENFEQK